jgi:glucose-1-phosphate cytidylyltransferase
MLTTIILAGGMGTRLSEYTETIPKPMVKIGQDPIIMHIIKIYLKYGVTKFCIALGYKKEIIIEYFSKISKQIIKVNKNHYIASVSYKKYLFKVELFDTGLNTMTGGRVKRIIKKNKEKQFFLTYGDGVSNVKIDKLLKFHNLHNSLITLTAVRPPTRFGFIDLDGSRVNTFREKSQLDTGWINGGFFVINRDITKYILNDSTFLEKEPMEKIAKLKKLFAYKHSNFWQCMDTKRDKEYLDDLLKNKKALWIK